MINGSELVVLLVLVAVVLGPERLPKYAAELARMAKRGRELLRDTQDRIGAELGDAGQDFDWKALDPRQYDPRRIVREALSDDPVPGRAATSAAVQRAARYAQGEAGPGASGSGRGPSDGLPVFDDEAT